ncbi:ATP-binding cassette domain-containing protein [Streptomyces drozdowiczii]|uniref:ABC transporter ATP-binding protein n=1 Tax=Streptomyces drozdowiczii TaxID=202862 RepID=UPI0031E97310
MNSAPQDVLVHAERLTKTHGNGASGATAVDGIDFSLRGGEAFGFLGPNGAGKSTTMRMISCVSRPTGGTLRVLGMDPVRDGTRIRSRIGVIPQADTLDQELTVLENLLIYGRYFGLGKREARLKAAELLDFAQLQDKADAKVSALSGGMRRRLTIARALVNDPELLLLDEPTTGLDPQARHVLWERLFRLKQQGVTLILTTHYMDEAEQLCDRLVVMDRGHIVAEGSPRALIEQHATREVLELRYPPDDHELMAAKLEDTADRVEVLPDRLLLYTADAERCLAAVRTRGVEPLTLLTRRATLEDVFLTLTGRTLID